MFAEVAILVDLFVVFGLILKHQQLSLYNMFREGVEATLQKHREGLDEIFRKHLEAQRRQSATTGYHQSEICPFSFVWDVILMKG
jgi:hypothetical protein